MTVVNVRRRLLSAALVLLGIPLVAQTGPSVRELIPTQAPVGARIVVRGHGLQHPAIAVAFVSGGSAEAATVIARSESAIEVIVPQRAKSGVVRVSMGSTTIEDLPFTLTADPVYKDVRTLAGHPGTRRRAVVSDINEVVSFESPYGAAVFVPSGDIYVADSAHNRVCKVTPSGRVSTIAGSQSGFKDGTGTAAQLKQPKGIAVDLTRNVLYIADTGNHSIRKITFQGVVTTLAGSGKPGKNDGTGAAAEFREPIGITVDTNGDLYVADSKNSVIRKITPEGVVTTFAGSGTNSDKLIDGPASAATFFEPEGVVASNGRLYIADTKNNAIRKIESGEVTTVFASPRSADANDGDDDADDNQPRNLEVLNRPVGIAVDDAGDLIVADSENDVLRKISLRAQLPTLTTIAGTGKNGYLDAEAFSAKFKDPSGIALAGAVFIADEDNDAIRMLCAEMRLTGLWVPDEPLVEGTELRIFGTGFVPGQTTVQFSGVAASSVTWISSTSVLAKLAQPLSGPAVAVIVSSCGGSAGPVTFTIAGPPPSDVTPPTIEILQANVPLVEGTLFGRDVLPQIRVTDDIDPTPSHTARLNAASFISLTPVTIDGAHTLVVQASDSSGNRAEKTVRFTVDKTPPVVKVLEGITPFPVGFFFNRDVVINLTISDLTPTTVAATINSQPYAIGASFVAEGFPHSFSVTVTDAAGNATPVGPILFTIDKTPPVVKVLEGTAPFPVGFAFNRDVLINLSIEDRTATTVAATINEQPYTLTTPFVPEGDPHSFRATVTDAAGNAAPVGPILFTIDKTPPVVDVLEGSTPFPAGFYFNRDVVINLTIDDLTATTVAASINNQPYSVGSPFGLEGDPHSFRANVTDAAGNATPVGPTVFTIDKTPPRLTFTSHHDGDAVVTPSLILVGGSDDAQTVAINGVAASVDLGAKIFTSAQLPLGEGTNTFNASGADKAGNNGSAVIHQLLDTRPPEVSINAPAVDACVDATLLQISGTASDSRLDSVKVTVGSSAPVLATIDPTHGSWTASLSVAEEGKTLVKVEAADSMGHTAVVTRSVLLDRSQPTIEVTEGGGPFTAALLNRQVSLVVQARDLDPNLAVVVLLDGSAYASGAPIRTEGSHTLVVTATDCAGHRKEASVAFTIDLTPPVITNLAPAHGSTIGTIPTTITGNTDTDAVKVELADMAPFAVPNADGTFTINGVSFAEGTNRFLLRATDRAGNRSEQAHEVKVKALVPSVEILEGGSPLPAGTLYNRIVTPVVHSNDSTATVAATISNAAFTSGTAVSADGAYTIVATATDSFGHVGRSETNFVIDRTPPVVKITSPATGVIRAASADVHGNAGDSVEAFLNGVTLTLAADGSFSVPGFPLELGENPVVAVGRDRAGNTGSDQIVVTREDNGPGVVLTYPPDHSLTNRPVTEVLGRALAPTSGGTIRIGSSIVTLDPTGAFRLSGYTLVEGLNTITATAVGLNGVETSDSVRVTGDFTPPSLTILESGQPLTDGARFAEKAVLSIEASDSSGGTVTSDLTLDGTKLASTPTDVVTVGGHAAIATARDAAGNESRVERTLFIGASGGGPGCDLGAFDPADGAMILASSMTLVGRTGGALGVKVNGVAAAVGDGSFVATVELPIEGANLVTVICTDANGDPTGTPVTLTVHRVTGNPSITISTPAEGAITSQPAIEVTGTVGPGVVSADVNGAPATIVGTNANVERAYSVSNVRLSNGLNLLVAHGRNGAGRVASASRRVMYQKDSPAISISSPVNNLTTGAVKTAVSGTWASLDPSTLTVTNLAAAAQPPVSAQFVKAGDTAGSFVALDVPLVNGEQKLRVSGRDRMNREASAEVTVKVVSGAPSITIASPADHAYFPANAGDEFVVSGAFQAAAGSVVEVNGVAATPAAGSTSYTASVRFGTIAGGLTPIVARVTEPAGASAYATLVVSKLSAAPKVIESFPAHNAVEVDPGAFLLVLFSAPMDGSTLAGGAFRLEDASGALVSGTFHFEKDVMTFAQATLLTPGMRYTMKVSTAATDLAGQALESAYSASFTIATSAPSTPPTVVQITQAICGSTIEIKGSAPAGARLQLESGSLVLNTTAEPDGTFTFPYPITGQSGFAVVRVRVVGSDGSLSPAAETRFRVDCVGPQVLNASYDRSGSNELSIQFSELIDPASATVGAGGALGLTLSDGRVVGGTATVLQDVVTLTPAENLAAKTFTLTVGTAIEDAIGNSLTLPYSQLFSIGSGPPPSGDGSGFISGEVFDATTGRPLTSASITISVPTSAFSRNPSLNAAAHAPAVGRVGLRRRPAVVVAQQVTALTDLSTVSDARGRYLVRLPEGAHTIRATANGYTTVWRQIIVPAGAGVVPIDIRLTKKGDVKVANGAAMTLAHGGDTAVTRRVELTLPAGSVPSGTKVTLTSIGAQSPAGLLPLGWSPIASVEITTEDSGTALAGGQLTVTLPAQEINAATQSITCAKYDEARDEWRVMTPIVGVAGDGKATVPTYGAGAYAFVYPDKAPGLAQPALPSSGAVLQGVAEADTTAPPLVARDFKLDPSVILPSGRTVATLSLEGSGAATYPSGTAVQAYVDEELTLADGSRLLDPPFATDLLVYRSLAGTLGVADFHLAPSRRAAEVILEVGFNHIRILPYPGRLDRGTLVGNEGGRVPADDKVVIEIPTGATPEPLRASARSLNPSDLTAIGSIPGFRVIGGFAFTLQRANEPPSQDLDEDGTPDPVPPVELFRPARATFTVDNSQLPSLTAQVILAELLDQTPHGGMVRLAALMSAVEPVQPGVASRFGTRSIDRAVLPIDGVVHEGRYLLLAAEAPIAYATGLLRLGTGGYVSDARITADSLGVKDLTRASGVFSTPVLARPAAPFTLTPRHLATGDGAPYTHANAPDADTIVRVGVLSLSPQPPELSSATVMKGEPAAQVQLATGTVVSDISLSTSVRATFTRPIDPGSITSDSITVADAITGERVPGSTVSEGQVAVLWTLTPGERFKPGTRYTISIAPSIRGVNGALAGKAYAFSFSTISVLISGETHPERIRITIPNADGHSQIIGTAGALPANWQAVAVRRGTDFVTRYQASADADGKFSFALGNGPDSRDRVSINDMIDLYVISTIGNLTSIIRLTPFVSEDGRGFIAPSGQETKFTSADGVSLVVPAGAFDAPTMIDVRTSTKEALSAGVPNFEAELNYVASVKLEFEGVAKKRLDVELPVPPGLDPNGGPFMLAVRGDSVRGPRLMVLDTLRVTNGKLSTTSEPTSSRNTATQATVIGQDVKNLLLGVNRSGLYMALDLRVGVAGFGWAAMSGLQGNYDIFWSSYASLFVSHYFMTERPGSMVVVPVLTGVPFTVAGVDVATGLQAFSRAYDPLPVGGGGIVPIPPPLQNTGGPYPVFGTPFRVEQLDLQVEGVAITSIRNFSVTLQNEQVIVTSTPGALPSTTPVALLNVTTGGYSSGWAFGQLFLPAKLGDRIVLLIGEKEIDPSTPLNIAFNEPIFVPADADTPAEIDVFLREQFTLEEGVQDTSSGAQTWSTLDPFARYSLDSGGRRVQIELTSALRRGVTYRLTMESTIADRGGSGGVAGFTLGQGTVADTSGNLGPVGGNNDLHVEFKVREPGGTLGSFDLSDGVIRDLALHGNLLFVAAYNAGLLVYDVANPASLTTAGAPVQPMARTVQVAFNDQWAVATDRHGRVYTTAIAGATGVLRSYRVEDFIAASSLPEPLVTGTRGVGIVSWRPGYSADILGLTNGALLSDRPEAVPRKISIVLQDKETTYLSRTLFVEGTGAAETGSYSGEVKKYTATFAQDSNNPYLIQRVTVENVTLDMRWSADVRLSSPAVITNIIARPGDKLRVLKNQRTYGLISLFGYGVGVFDLNAIESNDTYPWPSGYVQKKERVLLTAGENESACNNSAPELTSDAIPSLWLSPEAAIRAESASQMYVYGLDPYRGLLDLRFDPSSSAYGSCGQRAPLGMVFNGNPPGGNHPRIETLKSAFVAASGSQPFPRFNSLSYYRWSLPANQNPNGARGSTPNQDVTRDYVLVAGLSYGLLVVEVAGNPAPAEFPSYFPLSNEHLVDVIWIPGGALAVRVITGTNLALVTDRAGRVLLVDLSRIDERWNAAGLIFPTALFPTAAAAIQAGQGGNPFEVGVDDPRILWKSEPGVMTGSFAPVADADTGLVFAGQLLRAKTNVLSALDPRIRVMVNLGEASGLSEVGGIVPLGIAPPQSIIDKITALPPCAPGISSCRENASLGAFRLEVALPGGLPESLPGGELRVAIESERVIGAVTEQTPQGFPRSHLRRVKRDGSPEAPNRVATNFKLRRIVPNDPALEAALRHQKGFNRFVSPWIVAIADPRASEQYNWSNATPQQKKDAGCDFCERPDHLDGADESAGVYELWTNGRFLAVRPELVGNSPGPESIFADTPYAYLGEENRLFSRVSTVMADTVRPTSVLVAAQHPPVADGMLQGTVYLHSGELETSAVDLVAGGRAGFSVGFDRTYRSRTLGGTVLGLGWESSLFRRLRPLPNGDVELRDGGGEIWLFRAPTSNSGSSYQSPKGLFLKLTRSEGGWKMIDQHWRITSFDDLGRIVSESDEFYDQQSLEPTGNVIRYLYDDSGRLAKVLDPVQRESSLTYWGDADAGTAGAYPGLLRKIRDWRSREIAFGFDTAKGTLTSVALPDVPNTSGGRPTLKYTYMAAGGGYNQTVELSGNLEKIIDPTETTNHRVKFNYGGDDRILSQDWGTGESASFTFPSPIIADTTDALGQQRHYTLTSQPFDFFSDRAHVFTLDELAVVTSTSQFGQLPIVASISAPATTTQTRKFSFTHDAEGLIDLSTLDGVRVVDFDYQSVEPQAPGSVLKSRKVSPFVATPLRRGVAATSTVAPITQTLIYQTGPSNAITFIDKIKANDELTIESPEAHRNNKEPVANNNSVSETDKFDAYGRLKESASSGGTDSSGVGSNEKIFYEENNAAAYKRALPTLVDHGEGLTTDLDYPNQNTVVESDPQRGVTTTTIYDAWRRPTSIAVVGPGQTLNETFQYDAAGRLKIKTRRQGNDDITTTYEYDLVGRTKQVTNDKVAVAGADTQVSTITTYDIPNRKITIKRPGGSETTTDLDRLGRPVSAVSQVAEVGGSPIEHRNAYDLDGNLVYSTDLLYSASAAAYDAHGRAVATLASDGTSRTTDYDAFGRVKLVQSWDFISSMTAETRYDYTPAGALEETKTRVDANRIRLTRMNWDGAGRTTGVASEGRASKTRYDLAGRATQSEAGAGTLGGVTDVFSRSQVQDFSGGLPLTASTKERTGSTYQSSAAYNTSGDVVTQSVGTQSGGSLEWSQQYDQAGNLTAASQPGRPTTNLQYDSRGNVKSETLPGGGAPNRFEYDRSGASNKYTDPTDEITGTQTDLLGRPTQRNYQDGTKEIITWLGSRVQSVTDRQGRKQVFKYNDKGQLFEIRDGFNVVLDRIDYDLAGRIKQWANEDSAVVYENYDWEGRPRRTTQIRYRNGTGTGAGLVLDQYTQEHDYNLHGERVRWQMPRYQNFATTKPWTNEISNQQRDATGNIVLIERSTFTGLLNNTLLGADYRNAGRPNQRTLTTLCGGCSAATIVRNYGYHPENGLLNEMSVLANGIAVAGSRITQFDGVQKKTAELVGVSGGVRSNRWTYDERSRLKTTVLAREGGAAEFAEDLTPADFRKKFERTQGTPVDPPTIAFTEQVGHKIDSLQRGATTEDLSFNGAERLSDGRFVYAFDAKGRLALVTERQTATSGSLRRVKYFYDGRDRLVGRRAEYANVSGGAPPIETSWQLEDRVNLLSADALPAETTFVWDPISDQLVSVFIAGASQTPNIDANGGLLRQIIHGGLGYDDPIEVSSVDVTSPSGVGHLYPIYDEAGAGSLQTIVNERGMLVSRSMPQGPYGEDETVILGSAVDKVTAVAKKNANGQITSVEVSLRTTDAIAESTLASGVRLAAVDASGKLVRTTSVAPTLEGDSTAHWTLTEAQWNALVDPQPATVDGQLRTPQSLSVAATSSLRASTWSVTLPILPAPAWATSSLSVYTSPALPVDVRDTLAGLSQWLASLPSNTEDTNVLYEIPNLAALGFLRTGGATQLAGDPQRLLVAAAFHAQPFQEPMTGKNYVRARWLDVETGVWLTPDPELYRDSANLYAYAGGDPVNRIDPTGQFWEEAGEFLLQGAKTVAIGVGVTIAVAAAATVSVPIVVVGGIAIGVTAVGAAALDRYSGGQTDSKVEAVRLGVADTAGVTTAFEAYTGEEVGTGRTLSSKERAGRAGTTAGGIVLLRVAPKVSTATRRTLNYGDELGEAFAQGADDYAKEVARATARTAPIKPPAVGPPQLMSFGSDFSRRVVLERMKRGLWNAEGNAAVFEYVEGGKLQYAFEFAQQGRGHSEKRIAEALAKKGIDFGSVRRIYTEFAPCTGPSNCDGFIRANFPNAQVFYTFAHNEAGKAAKGAVFKSWADLVSSYVH